MNSLLCTALETILTSHSGIIVASHELTAARNDSVGTIINHEIAQFAARFRCIYELLHLPLGKLRFPKSLHARTRRKDFVRLTISASVALNSSPLGLVGLGRDHRPNVARWQISGIQDPYASNSLGE